MLVSYEVHHADDGALHLDELIRLAFILPFVLVFWVACDDDGDLQVSRILPHDLLQPPSTTRQTHCNNRVPVVAAHGMEVLDEQDERLRHSCLVITFDLHVGIPAWLRAIEW